MENFKHLGSKESMYTTPSKEIIDTFPNPGVSTVAFETFEFTSKCPVTGQPDFAKITINYTPKDLCIESKSLKLYLQAFRNEQAFMETLSYRICNDLFEAINPYSLYTEIHCTPRGGISLRAVSSKYFTGDENATVA